MLSRFFLPVDRCTGGPCIADGKSGNEILEEALNAPGHAEALIDGKFALEGSLPRGPRERVVPTYATAEQNDLRGQPQYAGNILQLKLGESIHEMRLAIHVNGFSLTPIDASVQKGAPAIMRAWSPFSLVEKCQVKTMQHSAFWAVFKLTVFRTEGSDRFYYFATSGGEAYKERDRWVEEMSRAISEVTMSLFPPHAITVTPLPGMPTTSTRIMAGYLLQSGTADNLSLYYCELHGYAAGEARLAVYKDEWCEHEVTSMYLEDTSVVSTRKGVYCTVFGVDQHRFCARTRDEKDLWLRAVSNIKVKLMFDAPDPTIEELEVFRSAILERIETLGSIPLQPSEQPSHVPLLTQVPRMPFPLSPRGDVWHPEPMEEGNELGSLGLDSGAQDKAVDLLQPEECRQLVRSVSPPSTIKEGTRFGSIFSCAGPDSSMVPAEEPGAIRTVHHTEKGMLGVIPEEFCAGPDDFCGTGGAYCGPSPPGAPRGNDLRQQPASGPVIRNRPPPSVPLLTWSPGRRQATQRAV